MPTILSLIAVSVMSFVVGVLTAPTPDPVSILFQIVIIWAFGIGAFAFGRGTTLPSS